MICEGIPLIGSSLARSETPNRGFSSKLPPPNPILNTQRQPAERGGGGLIGGSNQPQATSMPFCVTGKSRNLQEQFEEQEQQQRENSINIIESSIWTYYSQLKAPIVYRKYDNSQDNVIPSEGEKFFASCFVDPAEVDKTALGMSIKQGDSSIEQMSKRRPGELVFDSRFESGNLFAAFRISEREYDLVLQNDVNSKGNTQWFYFSVANTVANQLVKFNIVNLMKNDSLFGAGMKPVVLSTKTKEISGETWKRDGFSISYEKSAIKREGKKQNKYFYKLSFSYQFKHSRDTVLFAHCYPYTNSDLSRFIAELYADPRRNAFLSQTVLCQALDKSNCYLHTISSSSEKDKSNPSKQIVFLTARQHPGETPASFLMQGAMEFLSNPESEEAAFLRDRFEFKIIPMMNPDGVIYGNYRCSLSGVDLNRQWSQPSKEQHPTVYFAKKAILSLCQSGNCRLLCDFHGHSKKMNSFFYGNPNDEDPLIPRMLPLETSQLNKSIDFKNSSFRISSDKSSTFRQALLTEMPYNRYIYTFEASFFGKSLGKESNHFTIDDFLCLGKDVMRGLVVCAKNELQAGSFQNYELGLRKVIEKTEEEDDEKCHKNGHNSLDLNMNEDEIDEGEEEQQGRKHHHQQQQQQHQRQSSIVSDEGSDSAPSEDELSMNEKNSFANNSNNTSNQPTKQRQFQYSNQKILQFRSSTSPNRTHRNSMTRSLINDEAAASSSSKIAKNCSQYSKLVQTDSNWNDIDNHEDDHATNLVESSSSSSAYPMSPFRNPLINQALSNPRIDELTIKPSTISLQTKQQFPSRRNVVLPSPSSAANNQTYNFIKLKSSSNNADSDWNLESLNNPERQESSSCPSMGNEADKIIEGAQQQQLKSKQQQQQQQSFQQFRLSSYMGQKVPKEVVSSIQQELLLKTLNTNRLFVSGMKLTENITNSLLVNGNQGYIPQTAPNAITAAHTLSTAQSTLSQGIIDDRYTGKQSSDAGTQTDITFAAILAKRRASSHQGNKTDRVDLVDNNDNVTHTDPSGRSNTISTHEIIPLSGMALNSSDSDNPNSTNEQYDNNNNLNNASNLSCSSSSNATRKVIRGGSSGGVNRKMISSFYPSQSYSPRSLHQNNSNDQNNHRLPAGRNATGTQFYTNKHSSTAMIQGTAINNTNNQKTGTTPTSSSNFIYQQSPQQSPQGVPSAQQQQQPAASATAGGGGGCGGQLQPYQYNKNHLSYISPKKKKQYVIQIRKKDSMLTTTHTISSNSPNAQLLLMKTPLRDTNHGINIPNNNNNNNSLVIHSPLLNIFKSTIPQSYSSAGVSDPSQQPSSQSCRGNSSYCNNPNTELKVFEININSSNNTYGKGSMNDVYYAASSPQQHNSRSYSLTSTPSTQGSRRSSSNAPYAQGSQQKQFSRQQQQQLQLQLQSQCNDNSTNACISDMIKTRKLVAFSSPFKVKNNNNTNDNNTLGSQMQLTQTYEQSQQQTLVPKGAQMVVIQDKQQKEQQQMFPATPKKMHFIKIQEI